MVTAILFPVDQVVCNWLYHNPWFHSNRALYIYNSLILSDLNFCILAWGYKCDRIVKLQKKISRIISLSKYNAHIEPIFKRLKLLKVSDNLIMRELKFYYKFIHEKLPSYLQNLPLYANKNTHNYATRTFRIYTKS